MSRAARSLWIGSFLSPLHWTSHLIQSDVHGVYNTAFYGFLIVLGMLFRVPLGQRMLHLLLLGAVLGLISSMAAIAVVVTAGPNSFSSILKSIGPYPWLVDYVFYCGVVLLGPLWGMVAAIATYLCRRAIPRSS